MKVLKESSRDHAAFMHHRKALDFVSKLLNKIDEKVATKLQIAFLVFAEHARAIEIKERIDEVRARQSHDF